MTRVLIDCHLFYDGWFVEVLRELQRHKNIEFLYSKEEKYYSEIGANRKALEFFKLMGLLGKLCIADESEVSHRRAELESQAVWNSCGACDDPHIFAMVYVKPTKYIFSEDKRIGTCRTTINKSLSSRYCGFRVISSRALFDSHKHDIMI